MNGVGTVEYAQEFDSTWQWITWLVFALLFIGYYILAEKLRDKVFPNIVTDQGKRQFYNLVAILGGIAVFLLMWGYVLERIYN